MSENNSPTLPGKVTGHANGPLGYIVFDNQARRNAMSLDMLIEAEGLLRGYAENDAVRAVILTGAGNTFIAGADISKFESERSTEQGIEHYNKVNERVYGLVYDFPKPIIAMIRGYCIGGGLTMAMACDLRICSHNARFSLPATRIGLGYGYKYLKWFVEQVGPSFTREIFFTARQFDAQEALAMDLVNRCVPEADLEEYTLGYAIKIAENAPLSLKAVKTGIREILKGSEGDPDLSAKLVAECWKSNDYIEGRRAFMEKRKPVFTGR